MPTFTKRLVKCALGIVGQSNEQNRVLTSDLSLYPQAFGSISNPYKKGLMRGQIYVQPNGKVQSNTLNNFTPNGGMWWKFYDDMRAYGFEFDFFNGAIGNASLIRDFCGAVSPWVANRAYYQKRAPLGGGTVAAMDNGYLGDIVIKAIGGAEATGKRFRCTVGNMSYVSHDGTFNIPGQTSGKADSWFSIPGTLLSGATEPNWDSVTVIGNTITDGAITWTYEGPNVDGFPDGSAVNGSRVMQQIAFGTMWDPYGLLERILKNMETIDAERKYIVIQNAQADVANAGADYQRALSAITKFFADRGYVVLIGLSCFKTDTAQAGTITQYNTLQTARAAVLTNFNGSVGVQPDGAMVQPGANLYASMGTAIASKLDVGGVHLNGLGAIEAGGYEASAFKAFLPDRRPLIY